MCCFNRFHDIHPCICLLSNWCNGTDMYFELAITKIDWTVKVLLTYCNLLEANDDSHQHDVTFTLADFDID